MRSRSIAFIEVFVKREEVCAFTYERNETRDGAANERERELEPRPSDRIGTAITQKRKRSV